MRAGERALRGLARVSAFPFVHLPVRAPLPLPVQRRWLELAAMANVVPRGTRVGHVDLAGVPTEVIDGGAGGTMLYLHGGGYVLGSPRVERVLAARLAREGRFTSFSPAYRLAPEHPFPAAFDDSVGAYRALVSERGGPIVLAGDSAGAGLALAVAVAARDQGLPAPAGVFLICPWVDLAADRRSGRDRDPVLPRALLERGVRHYLGGADPTDPRCSPLHANLAGLPPLLVHVGTEDPLRDDGERLARSAAEAGVDVRLHGYPYWHDFHVHAGVLPAAGRALAEGGAFLRERINSSG